MFGSELQQFENSVPAFIFLKYQSYNINILHIFKAHFIDNIILLQQDHVC